MLKFVRLRLDSPSWTQAGLIQTSAPETSLTVSVLALAQTQPQMGEGLCSCRQTQRPTPNTAVCLPLSRLGPSPVSLHNYQDFREGRTIFCMGNWWTRTCRMNSLFWSSQLHANKTFPPQQQNHLSPFGTQEQALSMGLAASAPKTILSLPSAFLSLSSRKAAKRGDCNFQGFVTGKREAGAAWDAGYLIRASCWPLCTSWLALHMFKTLTGNILFCWITYQTTQQWNFQGLRNCAWS